MSKVKEGIRRKYSQVFNVLIPENQWDRYFSILDKDGHPNRRELLLLIIALGKQMEILENLVEELYFELETIKGNEPKKETVEEKPLRTPNDIITELRANKSKETKSFHISADDWNILEKRVDMSKGRDNPDFGYGKEIDPADNQQKTCLFVDDFPVFKLEK